jgi:hypothetical protein
VRADLAGRREQVLRPGGAQLAGAVHGFAHLGRAEVGQLVHDRVGPDVTHGGQQAFAVHHVGDDRLGAGVHQPLGVGLAAGDPDNLVAGGDELVGKRRPHGAGGAGEQHSHDSAPFGVALTLKTGCPPGV